MVIVVFRSQIRKDADLTGMEDADKRMLELARGVPGFISYKEFTSADGEVAAIVEFETEEQSLAWRAHPEHRAVQEIGRQRVFESYSIDVCKPVRRYAFTPTGGRVTREV